MRRALAAVLAMAAAPAADACDLDALRTYPMSEVVWSESIPIASASSFFRDPDLPYDAFHGEGRGGRDQVAHDRAALARALAAEKPALRSVLMLSAIADWTRGDTGILSFFVLDQGAYLEEVLKTLEDHRLTEHADIFRRGAALFGPVYGVPRDRYDRWSDGRGTILDPALDAALTALSAEYAALPSPRDIAVDMITQSAELRATFEALHQAVNDNRRLNHLGFGLWACVDHYDAPDQVAAHLADLPYPHRLIVVSHIFEAEMLNGSVHQFFFNSSGVLAPEAAAAFRDMGLPDHADAVQQGIDLFPAPYPRDLEARRDFMLAQGDAFDDALYELTYIVDDGLIRDAMIRIAAEADILPR